MQPIALGDHRRSMPTIKRPSAIVEDYRFLGRGRLGREAKTPAPTPHLESDALDFENKLQLS